MADAIFEPGTDSRSNLWTPTILARGPWSREAQHGGAPGALLARALESCGVSGRLVRLTVEFLRPVPLVPLAIEAGVAREGRQVQRSEAVMTADGIEVARAEGMHLRRREVAGAVAPGSMRREGESDILPIGDARPEARTPGADYPGFHQGGVEIRVARGGFGEPGPGVAWFRFAVPLVPGEVPSPMSRAVAACDFGNGISSVFPFHSHTFVNADVTVSLHRDPDGEWIGIDAVTRLGPDGTGVADCRVFDRHGPVGTSQQSLLIDRRA